MATRVTFEQFPSSIARIFGPKGLVGMGFLIGDRKIITCQHVAAAALGKQDPQGTMCLDFPLAMLLDTNTEWPKLRARVSRWNPYFRDGKSEVAVLELEDAPPPGAHPVCLVGTSANKLRGHGCEAFGYPSEPPEPPGGWFCGTLMGCVDYGWVQLNGIDKIGYFAKPGFSGSPVWDTDENGVVGMIVGRDRERRTRVAFVIPTKLLVEAWPDTLAKLFCDAEPESSQPQPKPYVEINWYIRIDLEGFEEIREEFKKQLAKQLNLTPEELEIGIPEPAGSIRVSLRIPKSAADQLYQMALTHDPFLKSLDVSNPFDNPGLPDPSDFPSRRGARKALGMSG